MMEDMVHQQIQAILKGEILYTRDVFVPKETAQEISAYDNVNDLKAASSLVAKLKETDCFTSVMEEIQEDNHVCVTATWYEKGEFINFTVRIDSMEISCDRNGVETGVEEMRTEFGMFSEIYDCVCRIADDFA